MAYMRSASHTYIDQLLNPFRPYVLMTILRVIFAASPLVLPAGLLNTRPP